MKREAVEDAPWVGDRWRWSLAQAPSGFSSSHQHSRIHKKCCSIGSGTQSGYISDLSSPAQNQGEKKKK